MKKFSKMLLVLIFMTTLSSSVFSQGDQTELTTVEDWANGGRALDLPEVSIKCKRINTGTPRESGIEGTLSFFYYIFGEIKGYTKITETKYVVICDNGFEDVFWM